MRVRVGPDERELGPRVEPAERLGVAPARSLVEPVLLLEHVPETHGVKMRPRGRGPAARNLACRQWSQLRRGRLLHDWK